MTMAAWTFAVRGCCASFYDGPAVELAQRFASSEKGQEQSLAYIQALRASLEVEGGLAVVSRSSPGSAQVAPQLLASDLALLAPGGG